LEFSSLVEDNGGEDNRNTVLLVYLALWNFNGRSMQTQVGSDGVENKTDW
jgi:hypothetical protein